MAPTCGRRWVYEQLWGPTSAYRGDEQRLVDYGRLEVDGPPLDGRKRWDRHDLQGGITDLTGHRWDSVIRNPHSTCVVYVHAWGCSQCTGALSPVTASVPACSTTRQ